MWHRGVRRTTPARCGVLPPHHLQHLADSTDAARAQRARNTLITDGRHRIGRTLYADLQDDEPAKQQHTPHRSVYDAGHSQDLPGKKARTEGEDEVEDESVNRAYNHLGATHAFYREVYGRDSLDGKGMPLLGSVHFGEEYVNAFWDGKQMAFGDGDGEIFGDFTIDQTVISHELSHGVIERTAKLEYLDQAGALNESVADVFGVLAAQYHQHQSAHEADWLIGAHLFTDKVEGRALRSLKAPGTAYDDDVLGKDPQPAHMDDYNHTFADNGGVHINSGIPNHAFYLLATELGGHAWEVAGRIWYETLTGGGIKRNVDFHGFAQATCAAAVKLHGQRSKQAKAVKHAWQQVGLKAA